MGHVLYFLLGLGILLMVLFLLWRIYFSGRLPEEMRGLSKNDALVAAYAAEGDALELWTQEQSTITKSSESYGYFSVPRFVYIPSADQLQLVFRYNNSTLEAAKRDFSLESEPPRGEEVFDVSLLAISDLTPDDQSDNTDGSENLGQSRIAPTSHTVTTTSLYTYFLYTFDAVEVTEETLVIYFDIYYGGAVDYGAEPYGTLRVYHKESPREAVRLKRAELEALAQ